MKNIYTKIYSPVLTRKQIKYLYKNENYYLVLLFLCHNILYKTRIGKKGYTEDAYKTYRHTLKHLELFLHSKYNCNEVSFSTFNPDMVWEFHQYLLNEPKIRKTIAARYLDSLNHILRIALAYGLLGQPICEN